VPAPRPQVVPEAPKECTSSLTLLRKLSKWVCGIWDNSRTDLELPDDLRPARGILFAIILAIPFWIALGVIGRALSMPDGLDGSFTVRGRPPVASSS
jgi:hypothetical protein